MKFFDSGAFQKIGKMLSHEKYIFHMLFRASHGTPPYTDPVRSNLTFFNLVDFRWLSLIEILNMKNGFFRHENQRHHR